MIKREEEARKKVRELGVFQNRTILKSDDGVLMLHQDDMATYNSWFLTEYHDVDKVLYRGLSEKAPSDIPNLKEGLGKIGNPKNIIVTFSKKDTY